MMTEKQPARPGVYYGWYIVVTAMFIAAVTTGARNGFGVFVIPMSEAFEWNRTTISVAAGIGWLMNGITQPFLGHLFDQFNSRKVILISLLVAGLATAGLSLTFHYLFLIFLFSFVLSTAMSGASIGTLGPLLARWFMKRRTFVLGLVASGSSIGGLILIPFSAYLVEAVQLEGVLDCSWSHSNLTGCAPWALCSCATTRRSWASCPTETQCRPLARQALRRRGDRGCSRWTSGGSPSALLLFGTSRRRTRSAV